MNVIILGATGGIGKWAVKHALEKGYQVTAYVRNPEKIKLQDKHLTIVKGEISDYETMRASLKGQDAVIWCVGIPSVHFEKDTKSFITIVPGIMAGILFNKAKEEMVAIGEMLKASDLDWTLVRFMAPKDSDYKGNVKVGFGDVKMNFDISREDIGAFMVEQVESIQYIRSMPIIGS